LSGNLQCNHNVLLAVQIIQFGEKDQNFLAGYLFGGVGIGLAWDIMNLFLDRLR
jgi:hypothetical protein